MRSRRPTTTTLSRRENYTNITSRTRWDVTLRSHHKLIAITFGVYPVIVCSSNQTLFPTLLVQCAVFAGYRHDYGGDCKHATSYGSGGIAVAVLSSASDGHQIKELQHAEVGTICVAVARQSLKQARRAVWDARGKAGEETIGRAAGLPLLGAVALRLLRRHAGGSLDGAQDPACLVLCCKLRGAIVAFPLDGAAFRLHLKVGFEDAEEEVARHGTQVRYITVAMHGHVFAAQL